MNKAAKKNGLFSLSRRKASPGRPIWPCLFFKNLQIPKKIRFLLKNWHLQEANVGGETTCKGNGNSQNPAGVKQAWEEVRF